MNDRVEIEQKLLARPPAEDVPVTATLLHFRFMPDAVFATINDAGVERYWRLTTVDATELHRLSEADHRRLHAAITMVHRWRPDRMAMQREYAAQLALIGGG